MNIMRKILSQGSTTTGPASPGDPEEDSTDGAALSRPPPEQDSLRLTHLKKLFSEYQRPPHPLSDSEKVERLYSMFPLFCKVFCDRTSGGAASAFSDLSSFAEASSRLMVSEVRKRAGGASTEAAAEAIAAFMEVNETSEESSNGWMLLSALNILSAEGEAINDVSLLII